MTQVWITIPGAQGIQDHVPDPQAHEQGPLQDRGLAELMSRQATRNGQALT